MNTTATDSNEFHIKATATYPKGSPLIFKTCAPFLSQYGRHINALLLAVRNLNVETKLATYVTVSKRDHFHFSRNFVCRKVKQIFLM